ncbi:MAG: hypothetical protein JNK05_37565 [Myxococcales bacterium]|nr:hypothetical protein [Myxococcales bacterium]
MESDDARDGAQDGRDVDREAILARRRLLVATAVAGLAMNACDRASTPVPCLTPVAIDRSEDAASPQRESTPTPCLAFPLEGAADASGEDASSAADASVADVVSASTPDAASARAPRVRPPRTRPSTGRVAPTACLLMYKPTVDEADD